jgi:hypothetical protein
VAPGVNEAKHPLLQAEAAGQDLHDRGHWTGSPYSMVITYHTGMGNVQKMQALYLFRHPNSILEQRQMVQQYILEDQAQAQRRLDAAQEQAAVQEAVKANATHRIFLGWLFHTGHRDTKNTKQYSGFHAFSSRYLPQVLAKMQVVNYDAFNESAFSADRVTIHYKPGQQRLTVDKLLPLYANKEEFLRLNYNDIELTTQYTVRAPAVATAKNGAAKKGAPARKQGTAPAPSSMTAVRSTEIPEGTRLFLPVGGAQWLLQRYGSSITSDLDVHRYTNGTITPAFRRPWTEVDKEYARLAKRRATGGYEAVSLDQILTLRRSCDASIAAHPELRSTCHALADDTDNYRHDGWKMYAAASQGNEPRIGPKSTPHTSPKSSAKPNQSTQNRKRTKKGNGA